MKKCNFCDSDMFTSQKECIICKSAKARVKETLIKALNLDQIIFRRGNKEVYEELEKELEL